MMTYMRIFNFLYAKLFSLLFSRSFGSFGKNVKILSPISIEGTKNIYLGNNILIAAQSCLAAVPLTGESDCRLKLGDGCTVGRFNHIYATGRIVLGKNVLTANNVYISDNLHDYRNPDFPILKQAILQKPFVEIGEGTWLGHNACVIGAKIGRNCVVGANSVVTRDIPDHCVVVGAPAFIIKRFNPADGVWQATTPDGQFLIP